MKDLKDFDITQIYKDTKVVVFKIPFNKICDTQYHDMVVDNAKHISNQLDEIGVKALFIDDSIQVEPLTDELISLNKFKSFGEA